MNQCRDFLSNNVSEPMPIKLWIMGSYRSAFQGLSYKSAEMRTSILKGIICLEFTVNTDVWSKQDVLICLWFSLFGESFSVYFSLTWFLL